MSSKEGRPLERGSSSRLYGSNLSVNVVDRLGAGKLRVFQTYHDILCGSHITSVCFLYISCF